jgi:hypothetical protein
VAAGGRIINPAPMVSNPLMKLRLSMRHHFKRLLTKSLMLQIIFW